MTSSTARFKSPSHISLVFVVVVVVVGRACQQLASSQFSTTEPARSNLYLSTLNYMYCFKRAIKRRGEVITSNGERGNNSLGGEDSSHLIGEEEEDLLKWGERKRITRD